VHRLHLEYLRHPRFAGAVFRSCRVDAPLRVFEVRAGDRADIHWWQDLPTWLHPGAGAVVAQRDAWGAGRWCAALAAEDAGSAARPLAQSPPGEAFHRSVEGFPAENSATSA